MTQALLSDSTTGYRCPHSDVVPAAATDFCYDSVSNRLWRTGVGCGGSTLYGYDGNGNMVWNSGMNLNFDWRNLLAKMSFPGNPLADTITFSYDPLRQRVKTRVRWSYCVECIGERAVGSGAGDSLSLESSAVGIGGGDSLSEELPATGATTGQREAAGPGNCLPPDYCPNWHFAAYYYIFDRFGRVVAEYDETVLKRLYYYGPNGRVSMRQISPSKLFHYLNDQIGSTRVLVQATPPNAGKIASSYDFYPYGETHQATVTTPANYLFTGQHFEDERNINLYYFGARYYDPDLLRFISVDPAGQYFSPYIYGGGNPTIGTDPNGEWFMLLAALNFAYMTYESARNANHWTDFIGGLGRAVTSSGDILTAPALSQFSAVLEGAYTSAGMSSIASGGRSVSVNLGLGTWSSDDGWQWHDLRGGSLLDKASEAASLASVYSDLDKLAWQHQATADQKAFESKFVYLRDENPPVGFDSKKSEVTKAEFKQAQEVGNPERGLAKTLDYSTKGTLADARHMRVGHLHMTLKGGLYLAHWDRIRNTAFGGLGAGPHFLFEDLPNRFEPFSVVPFSAGVAYSLRAIGYR